MLTAKNVSPVPIKDSDCVAHNATKVRNDFAPGDGVAPDGAGWRTGAPASAARTGPSVMDRHGSTNFREDTPAWLSNLPPTRFDVTYPAQREARDMADEDRSGYPAVRCRSRGAQSPVPEVRCRTEDAAAPARQGATTSSYREDTSRRSNAAGRDAAAFECQRISGTGHCLTSRLVPASTWKLTARD